jgi:hypothetical protein
MRAWAPIPESEGILAICRPAQQVALLLRQSGISIPKSGIEESEILYGLLSLIPFTE